MSTATPDLLSVDELAERAGVSVRTVRFYQSEGLLPPPERHGREVRYRPNHLDRLQVIAELQRRGLRLSAIADLLERTEGASVDDWLGLGRTLLRPWTEDHPALMTEQELAARLAGLAHGTQGALERSGLVERRSDTRPVVVFVPSPGMLEVAVELARLGVDLDTAASLRELLQRRLRAMAEELVDRFTDEVSAERLADGGPRELAQLLDRLQPLTERAVQLLFAHEMERAQRRIVEAGPAPASPAGDGTRERGGSHADPAR